jgi:hypothetical protein
MRKEPNEIIAMKAFIREFSPFWALDTMLDGVEYYKLVSIIKEIVEEM